MSTRRSLPFPTFLYTNQPPTLTSRNKQRVRPSPAQLADLKALYAQTPHPTREQREALGRRIGIRRRYQSVTNWFQNQRSTAKKRQGASSPPPPPILPPRRTDPVRDIIAQSSTRPAQTHSPLPLPLSGSSIAPTPPTPTPPAPVTPNPLASSFILSPDRASSPTAPDHHHQHNKGRRSRPTPHQLTVLRALHAETSSPTIEERGRVGREIGMELGKVTNWFRNLRQTARKKERIATAVEEDGLPCDDGGNKRPRDVDSNVSSGKRARWEEEDDPDPETAAGTTSETGATSETGTESDEAVTPEPSPVIGSVHEDGKRPPPSVDDALLLLALHDAR